MYTFVRKEKSDIFSFENFRKWFDKYWENLIDFSQEFWRNKTRKCAVFCIARQQNAAALSLALRAATSEAEIGEKEKKEKLLWKKVDSNAKGCSALSEHRKKAVKARVEVHALVTIKELPDKKKC